MTSQDIAELIVVVIVGVSHILLRLSAHNNKLSLLRSVTNALYQHRQLIANQIEETLAAHVKLPDTAPPVEVNTSDGTQPGSSSSGTSGSVGSR